MKIYITTPIAERSEKTYQEKMNGALERINSIKGHFKAAHGVQIIDVVTCITEAKISPSEPNFEAVTMRSFQPNPFPTAFWNFTLPIIASRMFSMRKKIPSKNF